MAGLGVIGSSIHGLRGKNAENLQGAPRHYVLFIYFQFIYLFLAALGLRCCARAFSSCGERGLLFIVVLGLLIVVASLVAEHGL